MSDAIALLLRKLDAAAQSQESVDVHAFFKQMTMQVIGTTAFGCARLWYCCCHAWA